VIGEGGLAARLLWEPRREDLASTTLGCWWPETVSYLREQPKRMDYPRYRRAGAAGTRHVLVESVVGEFTPDSKAAEYWYRLEGDGGEGHLPVARRRLSRGHRLARHFAQRPGNPYRRRLILIKAREGLT